MFLQVSLRNGGFFHFGGFPGPTRYSWDSVSCGRTLKKTRQTGLKEKPMNRIVRTFLIITTFQGLAQGYFFSTYVRFLRDYGLSLTEANLLNMIFMTTSSFLDPPTGYLGDRIGQRKVYVMGLIFWALGMAFYGLGRDFWGFALAEFTGAIGSALISGALESWLNNVTSDEIASSAVSTKRALVSLAAIPTAVIGGWIGENFGMQYPWFLAAAHSAINAILAIWLLFKLPEGNSRAENEVLPPLSQVLHNNLAVKELRFSLLVAFVAYAVFQPFNMFWAVVIDEATQYDEWLGLMWIGIATAIALGAYLANRKFVHPNTKGIAVALLIIGLPMVTVSLIPNLTFLIAGYLTHEVGRGALDPLLFAYCQPFIANNARTTGNSIQGTAQKTGSLLGLLLSGVLVTQTSPLGVWGISASALIVLALYALRKNH